MHPHHASTIQNVIAHFFPDPDILAILLSGSIARKPSQATPQPQRLLTPTPTDGFETPTSEVDILLLLTPAAFAARRASGKLTSASHDLATYPGGYVDAKYVSVDLIRDVPARGSEVARFAFEGVTVLFERDGSGVDVRAEVERAVRYPVEGKAERMRRFRAQLDAWRWFWREGRRKGDGYLVG